MTIKLKQGYTTFPFIDNKSKRTKSLSIGFEWEVRNLDCYRGFNNKFKDKVIKNGFSFHPEFGIEFQSPVSTNLAQARMAARFLQKELKKAGYNLGLPSEQSGIHVTVAPVSWISSQYASNFVRHVIPASLNHSSFKDFLWEFSGRPDEGGYSNQAKATCWDIEGSTHSMFYQTSVSRYQSERGGGACEFRFWAGMSHRLIPALEFAHSFFTFCFNKVSVPNQDLRYDQMQDKVVNGKLYVTLPEYKDWLFKRKGYAVLKKDKAWEHS